MSGARNRFHLNKRGGKVFGVCAGFADYLDIDTLWVRVAAVALTLLVSFVIIPLYIIIAMVATPRPQDVMGEGWFEEERRVRRGRARSRDLSRDKVRSEIGEMDRRLAEVEGYYATNSRLANDIERLR